MTETFRHPSSVVCPQVFLERSETRPKSQEMTILFLAIQPVF